MITITLSWPAKELSPNARLHWAKKAKFTRDARYAGYCAIDWRRGDRMAFIDRDKLRVKFTFHPADKRRRDLDNLISSTKAHRDGIADALGIDDSKFILSAEIGEPRKPACVVVEIS